MKRQVEMLESMRLAHNQFISSLNDSLNFLEDELNEASEITDICTDEWCHFAEDMIDDLHKEIYAISEPRWLKREDSLRLKEMRERVKNLYTQIQSTKVH